MWVLNNFGKKRDGYSTTLYVVRILSTIPLVAALYIYTNSQSFIGGFLRIRGIIPSKFTIRIIRKNFPSKFFFFTEIHSFQKIVCSIEKNECNNSLFFLIYLLKILVKSIKKTPYAGVSASLNTCKCSANASL